MHDCLWRVKFWHLVFHHRAVLPWLIQISLSVCFVLAVSISQGHAQKAARIEPRKENGFGRLIFSFETMPEYSIDANAGVLVIDFGEPMDISITGIDVILSEYFSVGRADPDGKAIRFALIDPIRVNAIEAGNDLYVDLLPSDWQGQVPNLPESVLAELAKRAEDAERKARDKILLEQMLRDASDVEFRIGRSPTFTRLQFDWPVTIKSSVTRAEDEVKIQFDRYGNIDLSDLNAQPTAHIFSAAEELTKNGMLVTLKVDPGARLRSFREGESVIFDISVDNFAAVMPTGDALMPQFAARNADSVINPSDSEAEPIVQPEDLSRARALNASRMALADFDQDDIVANDFGETADELVLDSGKFAPDASLKVDDSDGAVVGTEPKKADEQVKKARAAFDAAAMVRARVTTQDEHLNFTFPFPNETPIAAFLRANVVWVVFETLLPIDIREARRIAGRRIADITQTRSDGVTILRFILSEPHLVTASMSDKAWTITIGDTILEPTQPLTLVRGYREDGDPVVSINLKDAGSPHYIHDPIVGDVIGVVTASGPPRGVIKAQRFVDFSAVASSQGLALVSHSDDVKIETEANQVVVSRDGGLVLTAGDLRLQGVRRQVNGALFKSNYVRFGAWGNEGIGGLSDQVSALELAASDAPPEERDGVRLAAARLLLTHGLYTEAIGLIRLTAENNGALSRDPTFLALRGVANVLLKRTDEARKDLTDRRLRNSDDTKLWLGMADAIDGKWIEAEVKLSHAENALSAYPDNLKAMFRFAAVEAALETNDMSNASFQLEALIDLPLSDEDRGRLEIMNGRYAEAMGQSGEATLAYKAAIASGIRPVAADATWRLVNLQGSRDEISLKDGIELLEQMTALWRGDDIELEGMEALAKLYIADNHPRRAFELLKTANVAHSQSERTRVFHDHMIQSFSDLYLRGGADQMDPVEALGLFYDFRELTPVGRQGDEMIRRLSERLISVDLLDQAADLLDHQVHNRLKGAARAQVATQLAMVHLMNRQPSKALTVIQQSRQAVLPAKLTRQRVILEARALAETGRVDLAIERLKAIDGDDVERLRADVYWRSESWQLAAEQIERMLGERWSSGGALSKTERQDVMRAAIGFSLSSDDLGLDRLRRKFVTKMGASVDASAFDVVTAPIAKKGVEFRQLVSRIADIDTLSAFIDDYRERYSSVPEDVPQG